MKQRLFAALAAALGISGTAQAVYLNPHGTGQVLVFPYYTVNANQSTLLSLVNTTANGKALRVAFREGQNGRVVLDFNLYLSPFDVWSAEVSLVGLDSTPPDYPAGIATADNSCTFPAFSSAAFRAFAYTGTNNDTGPETLERTREGHFDVIEMGEITDAVHHTLTAISHDSSGVPTNCQQITDAWSTSGYWAADPTVDLAPPGGGLYGSEFIVDVAQGTFYAIDAEAIDGFSAKIQHTLPTDTVPDLNSANDAGGGAGATALVPIGGKLLQANYANPVDAVSALFMADTLYNEYDIDPTLGAASDWVVTFPTKRFYVDPMLNANADQYSNPPFDEAFGTFFAGQSCSPFAPQVFNREELTTADSLCGTPPGVIPYAFCYATSVITFGTAASVLGSQLLRSIDQTMGLASMILVPSGFANGHTNVSLTDGMDGCFNRGPDPSHALVPSTNGYVFQGMPAIGFLARNYINANVTQGVLANYSAAQRHRTTASCQIPTNPPADCQ